MRAISDCWAAFQEILPALVKELPVLKRPAGDLHPVQGPVARRMRRACDPFGALRFITPMAAVAGAVADELIAGFDRPGVRRASINNGGDIALHLGPDTRYTIGIWAQLERQWRRDTQRESVDRVFKVDHAMPVRGVATSGWRGRSFSLGIADSVTVLAADAAAADAAATLVANAVNCRFDGIVRAPAHILRDDSDLTDLLVTVHVPALPAELKCAALSAGRAEAERWRDRGLLYAAVLFLQGEVEVVLPQRALQRTRFATARA